MAIMNGHIEVVEQDHINPLLFQLFLIVILFKLFYDRHHIRVLVTAFEPAPLISEVVKDPFCKRVGYTGSKISLVSNWRSRGRSRLPVGPVQAQSHF